MRRGNAINALGLACALAICANAGAGERLARLSKAMPSFTPLPGCEQIEARLGQLLYVNVDGYQTKPAQAVWPEYIELARGLQLGGVLPHFGVREPEKVRAAVRQLQAATALPLLVGVDYWERFGLGYGGGALAKLHGKIPDACLPLAGRLEGLLHRAYGLNHALGPTIERSSQYGYLDLPSDSIALKARLLLSGLRQTGVSATMKHFPYTPSSYNLHKKVEMAKCQTEADFAAKRAELKLAAGAFEHLVSDTELMPAFAMSTHLFNCSIDADDVATFSPAWNQVLRQDLGYRGLLMTDALFMFGAYSDILGDVFSRWDDFERPRRLRELPNGAEAIYAARAILAGHDMVFLEGTAQQTRNVFDGLLYSACQDTSDANELRRRIVESFERIQQWKLAMAPSLRYEAWPLPAAPAIPELYATLQAGGAAAQAACADPTLIPQLDALAAKLAQQTPRIAFDGKAAGALDALTTPAQPPPYDPAGHILDK